MKDSEVCSELTSAHYLRKGMKVFVLSESRGTSVAGRPRAAGYWEGRDNKSPDLPGPVGGIFDYGLHKLCKPVGPVAGLEIVDGNGNCTFGPKTDNSFAGLLGDQCDDVEN